MQILGVDGSRKFMLVKFWSFNKKRGISMKYIVLYIYKKNKLVKRKLRIIFNMKNSILINSRLSNRFWAKIIEIVNYIKNRLSTRIKSHREIIPKNARLSILRIFNIFSHLARLFYVIFLIEKIKI